MSSFCNHLIPRIEPTIPLRQDLCGCRGLATSTAAVLLLFFLQAGCSEDATKKSEIRSTSSRDGRSTASAFSSLAEPKQEALADSGDAQLAGVHFVDVTEAMQVRHSYHNGAKGHRLMVEATGGGCGWIDYDRNGYWDLYLVQGGDPSLTDLSDQPTDQMFRNVQGHHFEAVTESARCEERRYGQGVAVGDFDNDGFDDLYVTNVGRCTLLQNQGDGTFVDVTEFAGVGGEKWNSSAAWGDIDRDGDLDLYVCRYVEYDPLRPRICRNKQGIEAMCHPNQLDAIPDEFFLNSGNGTFQACAHELGLFGPGNKALGVAIADFDNDSWPDIYIANDTTENFLFLNHAGKSFRESGAQLGCHVSADGSPQASMGIAVGDYDHNGYLDLHLTHFTNEWNTLYTNLGPQGFIDNTALMGLVSPTLSRLGFGTVMCDFDADGAAELFVANGHIDEVRNDGTEYEMRPQMFSFHGSRWHEISDRAGDYFHRRFVGRGVAIGDFDANGLADLVVMHQNAPAALLQNRSPAVRRAVVEFVGRTSNRRGIGTRVTLVDGKKSSMQELAGGTSYCSSMQPALFWGLRDCGSSLKLEIQWPSGRTQRIEDLPSNQRIVVIEPDDSGNGSIVSVPLVADDSDVKRID